MLCKIISLQKLYPHQKDLLQHVSFYYETAKETHQPETVFTRLFELHHTISTAQKKRDLSRIKKSLSHIKKSMIQHPSLFQAITIERLLGLEFGNRLHESFSTHNLDVLRFFNTHFQPKDYTILSTRRLSLPIKKAVRKRDLFCKPLNTYFLLDSQENDQEHDLYLNHYGLELYIPITSTKVAIFQGILSPDLSEDSFPDFIRHRIAQFSHQLKLDPPQQRSTASPTSQFFQSFFDSAASSSSKTTTKQSSAKSKSSTKSKKTKTTKKPTPSKKSGKSKKSKESGEESDSGSDMSFDSLSDDETFTLSFHHDHLEPDHLGPNYLEHASEDSDFEESYYGESDSDDPGSGESDSIESDSDQENTSAIANRTRLAKSRKRRVRFSKKSGTSSSKRSKKKAAKRRKLSQPSAAASSSSSSSSSHEPFSAEFFERFTPLISSNHWLSLSNRSLFQTFKHGLKLYTTFNNLMVSAQDIEAYMSLQTQPSASSSSASTSSSSTSSAKKLIRKINHLGQFFRQSSPLHQHIVLGFLIQDSHFTLAAMLYKSLPLSEKLDLLSLLPKWIKDPLTHSSQQLSSSLMEQLELDGEDSPFSAIERYAFSHSAHINPSGLDWIRAEVQLLNKMDPRDSTYHKKAERLKLISRIPFGTYTSLPNNVSMKSSAHQRDAFLSSILQRLDHAIFGHQDVKSKIIDIISQHLSNPHSSTKGFLLVGPPGTGKTSLVKAIAKAMGRTCGLIHLGGEPGRSMLVGHDFTYEGSEPGIVLRKVIESGCMNSVLCFDEVDKVGSGNDGTAVSNQLIKLSDPTQNDDWRDRYIPDIQIDLSKLLVIYTANYSDKVNPILKDRLEKIRIKPQTRHTKIRIAKDYLWPKALQKFNFHPDDLCIHTDTITYLIDQMPYESGCRALERKLEALLAHVNNLRLRQFDPFPSFSHQQSFHTTSFFTPHFVISRRHVDAVLADYKDHSQKIESTSKTGWINGLYACTIGGGILPIQVVVRPDLKKDLCTGSLGDVMLQSIKVSRTVLKSLLPPSGDSSGGGTFSGNGATSSGGESSGGGSSISSPKKHRDPMVHIHALETAVPKDGPSAGAALTTALYSAITHQPIKNTTAVTGEIDVFGNISAIGGLYEKLQGAKKAGITLAIIPEENRPQYEEVLQDDPYLIDDSFHVHFVSRIEKVLELMIEKQGPL